MKEREQELWIDVNLENLEGEKSFPSSHKTEASKNHTERNEDSFIDLGEKGLLAVFDGMGGATGGDLASTEAKNTIETYLKDIESNNAADWERHIEAALLEANRRVISVADEELFKHLRRELLKRINGAPIFLNKETEREEADRYLKDHPEILEKIENKILPIKNDREAINRIQKKEKNPRTGTTASVMKLVQSREGGIDLVYGHVGDSRIYILRPNKKLERLTKDQGRLQALVDRGDFKPEEAATLEQIKSWDELGNVDPKTLERYQEIFELRHQVTQALGMGEKISPQIGTVLNIEPGSKVVEITDGVGDNLTDEEIERIILSSKPGEEAKNLVEAAKSREEEGTIRSKADDKTALVLEVPLPTVKEFEDITDTTEFEEITPEAMEAELKRLQGQIKILNNLLKRAKMKESDGILSMTAEELGYVEKMGGSLGIKWEILNMKEMVGKNKESLAEIRKDKEGKHNAQLELTKIRDERKKIEIEKIENAKKRLAAA